MFTLLTQAVVGAFLYLLAATGFGPAAGWASAGLVPLLGLGMAASTGHLGKPLRAYRAIRNLRTSWLSREVVAVGTLFGGTRGRRRTRSSGRARLRRFQTSLDGGCRAPSGNGSDGGWAASASLPSSPRL